MTRFWMSWEQPTEDYRPLTYPPNESILGWWCSGYTSEDVPTICALVAAKTEDSAKEDVLKDWPEATGWRFISQCEKGWLPSDRFPLEDWMKQRLSSPAASKPQDAGKDES